MPWNAISEWRQKRTLRAMLTDPELQGDSDQIRQFEKGICTDRATAERLLVAIGARKSEASDEWTLSSNTT